MIKKLGNPLRVDEVVALIKTIDYDPNTGRPKGNQIELLSTRGLAERASSFS